MITKEAEKAAREIGQMSDADFEAMINAQIEAMKKTADKLKDLKLNQNTKCGSSRIAAYKGGFDFVGFEIDQEYYEKQEKRFNNFKSQLRLF